VEESGDFRFENFRRSVSTTIFGRYPGAQRAIGNRAVRAWKVDKCHLTAVGEDDEILYQVPFANQRDEDRLRNRGTYPACYLQVEFGELQVRFRNAIYWKFLL